MYSLKINTPHQDVQSHLKIIQKLNTPHQFKYRFDLQYLQLKEKFDLNDFPSLFHFIKRVKNVWILSHYYSKGITSMIDQDIMKLELTQQNIKDVIAFSTKYPHRIIRLNLKSNINHLDYIQLVKLNSKSLVNLDIITA